MSKKLHICFVLFLILALALPVVKPVGKASAAGTINFTILHTNDFHGQLEASGSNPGMARVAATINAVRSSVGLDNVLLVDVGDEMQGSLLSNLQKGKPVIDVYKTMGYNVATFGNHEFDWGQPNLIDRTSEANYPYVTANIVQGSCDAANWTTPSFAQPYSIQSVAGIKVGFIGVTSTETPTITVSTATQGLCFKDPADSILHYYDTVKSQSDVVVILSHLGYNDGGYGYGIPVYGDQTLAKKLIDAGKPVPLIIGGHSHTDLSPLTGTPLPTVIPPSYVTVGGKTAIVQAYYNGRRVGRADLAFDPATKNVTVTWQSLIVDPKSLNIDTATDNLIKQYSSDAAYQAKINEPIGYSQVDLLRNYNGDSMMGDFVDDAIYQYLNTDAEPKNDVDLFFNNAGGLRIDWCDKADPANPGAYLWSSTAGDCSAEGLWNHDPMLLNYGQMFQILPFGNATVVGEMTGAQILQVLNQSATLNKGAIQPSGIRHTFYHYRDGNPGPQPFAWGAFDTCVINKTTQACDPLDMNKTYKVGTNEFLAPAGGDNYGGFKYMTKITYWGDMLDAVNGYIKQQYGTTATAYKGPHGDGLLDGRIKRDGGDALDSGSILPISVLHNNDSHGNLAKGTYVGYTQLATLIKQERAHNPTRTLLLDGGDQIQGDAMMYYYKSAPSGKSADGSDLPSNLWTHPMMAVMNALGYDTMTLGNHEFNFGSTVFKGILNQANFPVLGANVADDGQYGLADAQGGQGVKPYLEKTLGNIKVAVLGITNHRVPNYELPSNIPGLTFSDPLATAQTYATQLRAQDDVVIALTHIGFTEDPKSVEVDKNVDTNMAAQVSGIDAIIGSHSHTNPVSAFGSYKYLPTIVGGPNNTPVIINQAYRYNNYLGEVIIGVRAKAGGGYEVVSRAGQYIAVTNATPEDPQTKAIVDPYVTQLATYNEKVVGQTTAPIDTVKAFTQETNGANLQADASVWELAQHGITDVDFHLSGAMTNKLMASAATPAAPVTLKISDMFAGMPYENSLVVLSMNGPQLKAVLERAYRNYYYYKYVPGYGGYSYYTTCMIDTNSVGKITYNDLYPAAYDASKEYVVSLSVNGHEIDFADASTYYTVSTVNYLAAGSCNFNNNGVSLWPLNQIVHDTQYYVRDAVIDYISAQGIVSPKIEGRLSFITDVDGPAITINAPTGKAYLHPDLLTLDFGAEDVGTAGLKKVWADLDGVPVINGQVIDLYTLSLGEHTLTVNAVDKATNASNMSVKFSVTATIQSLIASVNRFAMEGSVDSSGLSTSLIQKLSTAQTYLDKGQTKAAVKTLNDFIAAVKAQSGKHIQKAAANLLITDAQWVIASLK